MPRGGNVSFFYELLGPFGLLEVMTPSKCHTRWDLMGRGGQPWAGLQNAHPPTWMHMSFFHSRLLERAVFIGRVIQGNELWAALIYVPFKAQVKPEGGHSSLETSLGV